MVSSTNGGGVFVDPVTLESRGDAIWTLTINRPEKRNVLSLAVVESLKQKLQQLSARPGVRCVVITGAGIKAFAAGADLDELPDAFTNPSSARIYDEIFNTLYDAIEGCPFPVVAKLNGHAIGGGFLLALACDLRFAVETAKIGIPSGKIGLMLSPREYELLRDALSIPRAKQLVFAGTILTGHETVEWGLVNQIFRQEELDAAVERITDEIARAAPRSLAVGKRLLSLNVSTDRVSERDAVRKSYESIYTSEDLREGLAAVSEKRTPVFTGK